MSDLRYQIQIFRTGCRGTRTFSIVSAAKKVDDSELFDNLCDTVIVGAGRLELYLC